MPREHTCCLCYRCVGSLYQLLRALVLAVPPLITLLVNFIILCWRLLCDAINDILEAFNSCAMAINSLLSNIIQLICECCDSGDDPVENPEENESLIEVRSED